MMVEMCVARLEGVWQTSFVLVMNGCGEGGEDGEDET
jgi:hypothetical protein